jgi:hypothetical protein
MKIIDSNAAMAPAIGTLRRAIQGMVRSLSQQPAMAAEDCACRLQAKARLGAPA